MKDALKISIVFSFRNEEDVLEELINRVRKVFQEKLAGTIADYEMVFVNDVSTDRSLEILHAKAKEKPDIKILNMSRNFGTSPCVLAGMEYATGDAVVYMDADLQDPPEVIPRMVDLWLKEKADVVHTRRLSRAGESRIKMFITRIGYAILSNVSHVDILREVGDFKLLSRRAVNELIKLKEKKPFTRGLVNWIGFKQVITEYHREARFGGDTKFPVLGRKVISNFLDSALISFSDVPLKLSLLLGFLVSFGAFVYLIVVFFIKFLGLPVSGWAAIMAAILLLGGIQLFTLGVMGLYINSIYLETKNRPNFIVESTFGFEEDKG